MTVVVVVVLIVSGALTLGWSVGWMNFGCLARVWDKQARF